MDPSARVTSIDALREFRAAFLIFCDEAREAIASVEMEAQHSVDWLLRDQLSFWKRAIRDRQEALALRKSELYRKQLDRITGDIPDTIQEKKAVRRAEEKLREAEEKAANCREWGRKIPRSLGEFQGPARQLAAFVEGEPPPAVVLLDRILGSLEAYLALETLSSPAPAARMATSSSQAVSINHAAKADESGVSAQAGSEPPVLNEDKP